ncbi:uncharacterized protein LOC129596569 [Paramacrobiotus metropolitanus]|uniref:uncharacterized protein LOC129596569 n=1 Tax=Paramacrobiotus metropolitanus TaxID=2943436 RepID=UPI002445878A|nr:uncharacterized protein LOC129596569 [Paramacrobiotus metropolitanus]
MPMCQFSKFIFASLLLTAGIILPVLSGDFGVRHLDSGKRGYGISDSYSFFPSNQRPCETFVLSACDPRWLYCTCGKPVYNVSAIPVDQVHLYLGTQTTVARVYDQCYSSCLLPAFDPLPPLPNTTLIRLSNIWVAPNDLPFPVGRFLVNVKKTVKKLWLMEIYLPSLTRDTFTGFSALESLILERNRLSAIALDALEAFVPPPGRGAPPSRLEAFSLTDNYLEQLDWSMMQPLADTIKHVSVMMCGVRQLHLSRFFSMRRIESVNLAGNNLTSVDSRFLDSLTQSHGRPGLSLHCNPLCTSDVRCRCAPLSNLWSWFTNASTRVTEIEPGIMINWQVGDGVTCGQYTDTHGGSLYNRFRIEKDDESGRTYTGRDVQILARWMLDGWKSATNLF